MNRPLSRGPWEACAARAGRVATTALELACKAAVAIVGMALFLGMLAPRHVVTGAPGGPSGARVDVRDDGQDARIFPRFPEGEGIPRLILHDPTGQEACAVEYHKCGLLMYFRGQGHPVRVGMWVRPDGGVSWSRVGRRATTVLEMGSDGAIDVLVRDGGELGRIRVPAEGEPAVASGGP